MLGKFPVILEVYYQNPGRPFQSKQDKVRRLKNAEGEKKQEGLSASFNELQCVGQLGHHWR